MYRGEYFNSITHLVGAALALGAVVLMITLAAIRDDAWKIVAVCIYGGTLILLYLFSTLYHSLRGTAKRVFRVLDHQAIYLLIAGTYTPFLLVAMRSDTGWWLFGAIWTLATAGVLTKLWFRDRFPRIALAGYLVMGWLVVIALPQVVDAVGSGGMAWLVAGGLSYTIGAAFYAAKRVAFGHAIWHVFVLAASGCFFAAISLGAFAPLT